MSTACPHSPTRMGALYLRTGRSTDEAYISDLGGSGSGVRRRGAGQRQVSLAVDFATLPTNTFFGSSVWNLGYKFQANANITIGALGNLDYYGTGFSQPQQVGLWTASGTLLASTYVTNADPLTGAYNDWRFNPITPITLIAGDDYVIGGQGGAYYTGVIPITVNPLITYLADEYTYIGNSSNNPLVFPSTSDGYNTTAQAGDFGGSFQIIPKPATMTTLGIGILSLAGYCWRRRRQTVSA